MCPSWSEMEKKYRSSASEVTGQFAEPGRIFWKGLDFSMRISPTDIPVLSFCCRRSVAELHPTPCDPMDCSSPGFLVLPCLPELVQIHVRGVGDGPQTISLCRITPFTTASARIVPQQLARNWALSRIPREFPRVKGLC